MGRIKKWTEEKISALEREGRGRGCGAEYIPWLQVGDFSSLGRVRRVSSFKTRRVHHLFSDVEYRLFLALEWSPEVTDIREQFPLEREATQECARAMQVRHPYYPGTHVPTVMTTDFLVTKMSATGPDYLAVNAKRDDEADDEKSLIKLEIQRRYFEQLDIPHVVIYHSQIPEQKVKNIEWLRMGLPRKEEIVPFEGFFDELCQRMTSELPRARPHMQLNEYASSFDVRHGLARGSGLRIAKILMYRRVLQVDLESTNLEVEPLSSFVMTALPGQLRAVGVK